MKYDFDKPIERQGTHCVKWDEPTPFLAKKEGKCIQCNSPSPFGKDWDEAPLIPLWVADMDFEAAPAIREALKKRVDHGVFGYAIVQESYYDAVINWYERRHQWHIEREWIQYTTGVVPAISAVIKALTMLGERVLILTPVYNCFFSSIRNNGCEVVESPLIARSVGVQACRSIVDTPISSSSPMQTSKPLNSRTPELYSYAVNWEDFEAKCADEKTTVFLLCNPHNPAGRVWTREELQRMNDICQRNHVRIISDEIHCELIMPGHEFVPFGRLSTPSPSEEDRGEAPVICCSPSKSFNTAGLQMANIICADAETRRRINRAININEICDVNPFAPLAVEAAYNEGGEWIDELNQYLWANYQALLSFFTEHLPQLKVFKLEGTYLVWVDITETGLSADEMEETLLREARVWVNSGTMYGTEGYIRINIATQRARLMEGLQRIAKVLNPMT